MMMTLIHYETRCVMKKSKLPSLAIARHLHLKSDPHLLVVQSCILGSQYDLRADPSDPTACSMRIHLRRCASSWLPWRRCVHVEAVSH